MAIVFVSPRQKQRLFLTGIIALFVLILITISLFVFLSKPNSSILSQSFKKPDIKVNLAVLDSDQLKYFSVAEKVDQQFIYKATATDGKIVNGKILAVSEVQAEEKLRNMNLSNITIEGTAPGRVNPFIIYYQNQTTQTIKK